jgi:hypothetical protein
MKVILACSFIRRERVFPSLFENSEVSLISKSMQKSMPWSKKQEKITGCCSLKYVAELLLFFNRKVQRK